MLVNGKSGNLISIRDRGLLYGDGVFRTLLAHNGIVSHRQLHLQKILHDCTKLGISCPACSRLSDELDNVLVQHPNGVIKLIVTRGQGMRGYAPAQDMEATHIWDVAPLPVYADDYAALGVMVHVCETRLSEQKKLAGIKHLNRLENVLAAAELGDVACAEGLMLDAAGQVISGTRSNLFMLKNGQLATPDVSRCGVAGVQRDRVIAYAKTHAIAVQIRDVSMSELLDAEELFLVNSVIAVWPVRALLNRQWHEFSFARQLQKFNAQEGQ